MKPRQDTTLAPSPMDAAMRFVHGLRYEDLPDAVIAQAKRCLLDLCGVAAAGVTTDLSRIARAHAATHFESTRLNARMLFDGRRVSLPGAALAGGMSIDSLDAHDGHVLTKGHAGVAVLPVLLALADAGRIHSGQAFLCALVIGYEVATRAGIALHQTACDYHTSGAWNALAAAALGARALGLSPAQTREALGIAEYHGPRSQMMRCIDHPTMVKDGSGWGAMAGLDASLLAQAGFTGAPALTLEAGEVGHVWADLGQRWRVMEQYFKAYPVCRWAQPAVEAALSLARAHGLRAADIRQVTVASFHQACRLATRRPASTEEAQYSLPFAVAMALARGRLGAAEVAPEALRDPEMLRLAANMQLQQRQAYDDKFPAERWADVRIDCADGRVLRSEPHTARGDPESALSTRELEEKFTQLVSGVLPPQRARAIQRAVAGLDVDGDGLQTLLDLVLTSAD